ncbi:MAG: hypothetical protein ACRDLT_07985 [Solirubrobacteraceae bacterium]
MKTAHSNLVVWFGVLGGSAAWAIQFVANLFLTFYDCGTEAHGTVELHPIEVVLGAAAILVGLASTGVAAWLYRDTRRAREMSLDVIRGFGGEPPLARVHFLAIVGLTVNFLSLAIVVMTTIGSPELLNCRQS